MTATEIRDLILKTVSANGGHLASSLGAVEIAMALAEVFDPKTDRVVWDVGHQAYAWKILTDRGGKDFSTLRQLDGVSPFPNPLESRADAAFSGHAGAALSVAVGLAAARDLKGTSEHVIAVVGDAAIVNGMSFEALNNCAAATKKVILVLNDNEMSISRPTGSFAKLLGRLITGVRYNRVKKAAENAGHALKLTFLRGLYHKIESRIKSLFLGNAYFEQFGLRYVGPVDGHNLKALVAAFTVAKEDKRSVIVHVVTKKGKGYPPAEKNPTKYHGVGAGELEKMSVSAPTFRRSWSDAFGSALCEAALQDDRIVALTAGMKDGTGLEDFAREFPRRFFDVGIAEEHMIAFAGGLAAAGLRPVIAVYSTFLQRAVDQVMHDVCLGNLPVIFCVDRAGAVGADGVTHQGLYDFAMLKCLPNLTICQPKDAEDLKALLAEALKRKGPTVIRYPRGKVGGGEGGGGERNENNHCPPRPLPSTFAIWATGDQLEKAYAVAEKVGGEVTFARYLKPFDAEELRRQRAAGMKVVSIENGAVVGGFGEAIGADFRFGWPDEFIPHGPVAELEKRHGFDVDSIVASLALRLKRSGCLLLAALGAVWCLNAAEAEIPAKYGRIARRVVNMLPKHHVDHHPFDNLIANRAWTNLVTFYDYDHSVFLRSDLESLTNRLDRLDDELKAGDVSFGFLVHDLYIRRLAERIDFATNLLTAAEFDFTTNETFCIRRKDAPWPATRAEAEDFWRRRMKNEVLVQLVNAELDGSTNAPPAVENLVKKYHQYALVVSDPDEETIFQQYMSAVCHAYDPHTDYLSPASKEDFDMDMNLTLCGVGAVLSMEDGALKITEVMPGGPMDRDGRIKEGDKIVGVKQEDGELEDVMWQPMRKSIKKIRGKKGTRVTLQVVPRSDASGASKHLIELTRDEIKLEDHAATGRVERVVSGGITNRLGYLDLPGFYETMEKRYGEEGFRSCALDVARYLAEFNAEGVGGLALDLRGNGGGSLKEAVLLSALFVQGGPVVQIKDGRSVGSLPIPPSNPVAFRKPMVILIDRASASASEIVAGHLQDVDRAIILGDVRTHGKGTVQTMMGLGPAEYGSMKITTARFYRVNGRSTQVEGVSADILVPSVISSLEIGEDKLTYALPFSRILPADYALSWNLHDHLPELARRAAARLKEDARYQRHLKSVEGMKVMSERRDVPLEYVARKEMIRGDRALMDGDKDEAAEAAEDEAAAAEFAYSGRRGKKGDDPVLEESLRILADLVELAGGEEIPIVKGWWR